MESYLIESAIEDPVRRALADIHRDYEEGNPNSKEYFERAASFPGGTTRSTLYYKPFPLTIVGGKAARLIDADGHEYVDMLSEYSAGLYGHSNNTVRAALLEAIDEGLSLGGPNKYEAAFARFMTRTFPSVEKIRFCNSGTEANLFAVQLARHQSRKKGVLAFKGGYHGGLLSFANGPMPLNIDMDVILTDYNDVNALENTFTTHAQNLGTCIIEPFMAAAGAIPATADFLKQLRRLCTFHDLILIFDEVVSSRLALGGLQQAYGVNADLTTFGKYLGGGMSFGAFGGRHALMDCLDTRRADAISHPGTFNNNSLSMACGLAATQGLTAESLERINTLGDQLRSGVRQLAMERDVSISITGLGSLSCIHFQRLPINSPGDIVADRSSLRDLFHIYMLMQGCYLASRGSIYLSFDSTSGDVSALLDSTERFSNKYRHLLRP